MHIELKKNLEVQWQLIFETMRKYRERLTYTKIRDRDMRIAYRQMLKDTTINMRMLSVVERANVVRRSQAPMLYISAEHCRALLWEYYNNGNMPTRRRYEARERQMYVVREYERLATKREFRGVRIIDVCKHIVTSPAPSFYCDIQKAMCALFYYKTIKKREEKYAKEKRGCGDSNTIC